MSYRKVEDINYKYIKNIIRYLEFLTQKYNLDPLKDTTKVGLKESVISEYFFVNRHQA